MLREVDAHFTKDGGCFEKKGRTFPYEDGLGPYEYLMGGLCGCFTSTLEDILEDEGVEWERIDVHAAGEKRETEPTTLKTTRLSLKIAAPQTSSKEAILAAVEKAKESCSMYQTIKCVSEMFVDTEVVSG